MDDLIIPVLVLVINATVIATVVAGLIVYIAQ